MTYATAYDYDNKPVSRLKFDDRSLTKQASKQECDINFIINKFQQSGLLSHTRENPGQYADFEDTDYHEAMNIVADANSMFESIPSSIRAKFENDPGKFLDFATNPDNIGELRKLGLAPPEIIKNDSENEPSPAPKNTPDEKSTADE